MRSTSDIVLSDLCDGLAMLICQQAAHLALIDWHDPEAVALAEKRGRIIQVHRGNVEKTLGMNDKHTPARNQDDPFGGDTAALREELGRRLLRHADALGPDELARRLRARGIVAAPLELDVPGEAGSDGAKG